MSNKKIQRGEKGTTGGIYIKQKRDIRENKKEIKNLIFVIFVEKKFSTCRCIFTRERELLFRKGISREIT